MAEDDEGRAEQRQPEQAPQLKGPTSQSSDSGGRGTEHARVVEGAVARDPRVSSEPSQAERIALYAVVFGAMAALGWGAWTSTQPVYEDLIADIRDSDLVAGCKLHFRANLFLLHTGFGIRFFGAVSGAVVALLGAMFVLHRAVAAYELNIAKDTTTSVLKTSSPGLVMITLGLAVLVLSVRHSQTYTLDSSRCIAIPTTEIRAGAGVEEDDVTRNEFGTPDRGTEADPQ